MATAQGRCALFLALAARLLHTARTVTFSSRNVPPQTLPAFESFSPQFVAPQLTPMEFLLVSSPVSRKVVYTPLKNFKSKTGRTFALIDSGLSEPCGLAVDRERGALYVADRGFRKIFRYRLAVRNPGTEHMELRILGDQLTMVQDVFVEWVAVDPSGGDVFYSDIGRSTINRVPYATVVRITEGTNQAGDLRFISERELEGAIAAQSQQDAGDTSLLSVYEPRELEVLSMYQAGPSPQVGVPGGLAVDGLHIFWTNAAGGGAAGSAVRGTTRLELPQQRTAPGGGAPSFPAVVLSNATEASFGVAKSNTVVLFSSNMSGTGAIYGVGENGGHTHTFVSNLGEPRGLVWDGDQTVYVADHSRDTVWSFPAGRLIENAPLTRSAVLQGPFGVAILSERDPAFYHSEQAFATGLRARAWAALRFLALLSLGLVAGLSGAGA